MPGPDRRRWRSVPKRTVLRGFVDHYLRVEDRVSSWVSDSVATPLPM